MPISEEEFKNHAVHSSLNQLEETARSYYSKNDVEDKIAKYILPYKNALNDLPRDLLSTEKLDEIKEYIDFILQSAQQFRGYGQHQQIFYSIANNYSNYLAKLNHINEVLLQNTIDNFKQSTNEVRKQVEEVKSAISLFANQAEQAEKEIENLESEKSEQIVAETYHEEAKEEEKKARFWLKVATGCILIALTNAFLVLYVPDMNDDAKSTLIQIFPISLFLLTGSGISAAFAKFHRNNEKEAKRIALEMSAIQPFIAPLQSADRKAVISILALKYFSGGQSQNNSQIDTPFIEKVAEKLIDGIKNNNNDG